MPHREPPTVASLVPPHGGTLRPLIVPAERLQEEKARAATLPSVRITSRETSDLVMMASGAFSPLEGFMCRRDYAGVVRDMHMADGTLWPVPITLAVEGAFARTLREGAELALVDDESGRLMAVLTVADVFEYDRNAEARMVFRTEDAAHPGVAKLYRQADTLVGGRVRVLDEGGYPERFGDYYARPAETRRIFEQKAWKTIAAFQVRNPIHRSHEYCTKIALEITDGLFIHPLVGKLKDDDIPSDVRMKCYEVLLEKYYPRDRVVCKVYPMEMRYAGPREAVLHAVFRQNHGCSHLIVGRDHAGVGNYYGPFDAQAIFDQLAPGELHIKPLKIDWTFWCRECKGMASPKTCPHGEASRLMISGTKLRTMLANGEMPPEEFSRPEVLRVLIEYYGSLSARGKQ